MMYWVEGATVSSRVARCGEDALCGLVMGLSPSVAYARGL